MSILLIEIENRALYTKGRTKVLIQKPGKKSRIPYRKKTFEVILRCNHQE